MNLMELFVKIGADTSELDKEVDGIGEKVKNGIGGALGTAAKVGGAALAVATGAVVAFGKSAVDTGMGFDSSMAQVAATMGKTMDEMENEVGTVDLAWGTFSGNLRDYAQEMGANTAFSAKQAADALNYMALAGYDTQTSMQMLPNVLNLAAAGGMDLANASDMVTDASSALGLSIDETTTLVDRMAAASSKSNTSVEQLGSAILTIGGTAKQLGGTYYTLADGTRVAVDRTAELSAALGILADNGIKGSEGGTALRNTLSGLASQKFEKSFGALGVAAYDAEGNMRPLRDILSDMNGVMDGMTTQEKTNLISSAFNARDLKSINALLATTGERWDDLTMAINESTGAAQAMADTQLDNLAGDLTLLQSAFEGFQIVISDSLTPTLREFVQLGSQGLSEITKGFKDGGLDGALDAFGTFLSDALGKVVGMLPALIDSGAKVLMALLKGITDNIPRISMSIFAVMRNLVSAVIKNLPLILGAGVKIGGELIKGITKELPKMAVVIGKSVSELGDALPEDIKKYVLPAFGSITAFMRDVFQGEWGLAWEEVKNIFRNAWNGLSEFFSDRFSGAIDSILAIDWIDVGEKILDGIFTVLTDITHLLLNIFTDAVNAIISIDWGDVGGKIFTFLTDGWGQFVEFAKNIFTMAKDAIAEIDWVGLAHSIVEFFTGSWEAIWEGIQQIDWLGLGITILDLIKQAFVSTGEFLATYFWEAWEVISNVDWIALGETIWNYIVQAFLGIWDWALTTFEGAKAAILSVDWVQVGTDVWEWIKSAFATIFDWGYDTFNLAIDGIKSIDWVQVGTDVWDWIKSAFSTIFDWGYDTFNLAIDGIKSIDWVQVGNDIWDWIVSAFSAIGSWAGSTFREAVRVIKEDINWEAVGEFIWTAIKTGVGFLVKGAGKVITWAGNFGKEIVNGIKETNWEEVGQFLWDGIKAGVGFVTKGVGKVITWGVNFGKEIVNGLSETDWEDVGNTLWGGIKEGVGFVTKGVGKVITWGENLGKEIVTGIQTTDWAAKGTEVWDAIKGGFKDVTGFFTGLFDFSGVHIKWPHITVDWEELAFGIQIPKNFHVVWEAKGYDNPLLLNSRGILGGYGFGDRGNYQGGEMVYSHDRLMDDIKEAVGGNNRVGDVTINVYQQPGEDAEDLAERISRIMTDDYDRRAAMLV